jgi:hypothetical protein
MRSDVAFSLLISGILVALAAPMAVAQVHHAHPRLKQERTIVRPDRPGIIPPGWYKFPGYPPIPPEQNRNLDPSNFGGG